MSVTRSLQWISTRDVNFWSLSAETGSSRCVLLIAGSERCLCVNLCTRCECASYTDAAVSTCNTNHVTHESNNFSISVILQSVISNCLVNYQLGLTTWCAVDFYWLCVFVTFRVRHSQGKMYIGHGHLCVCLSVCLPSPHSHTTAHTWMELGGIVGVPSNCALLGGFAIGAWVSLLWQHACV